MRSEFRVKDNAACKRGRMSQVQGRDGRAGLARSIEAVCVVGLMLAGALDARSQELRAGYAKADITPAGPVMMGGYDLRGAPSDGIHGNDKLYARALVFEASGVR